MLKVFHHLKKNLKHISVGIKLLVIIIFLRSFGWGFIDPYWSIYLKTFTDHYFLVGILSALASVSALFTTIPLMCIADKVKESVVIKDGEILYFFVIFFYILAGLFKSLPILFFTLILNGVSYTFITFGTEAYIRKHSRIGDSSPFAYYIALDYLGWILGMFISSFLILYYNLNYMFLFGLPAVFLSFLVFPYIHEKGIESLIRGVRKYFHNKSDFINLFDQFKVIDRKLIFFFILSFFDGAIRIFSFIFIPLLALQMHLDLSAIAMLMVLMYIPFIFSYFINEFSNKLKKMHVIAFGLALTTLSFVSLFFIIEKDWLLILTMMLSFSLAVIRPAYNGAISSLSPRRILGSVTGLNTFSERLGRILGPIATGFIADLYGLQISFLLIAIVAFGLGLVSLLLRFDDTVKFA